MFKVKDGIRIGAQDFVDGSRNVTAGTISASDVTISGELKGPATMYIDPAAIGDNTGTLVIRGNLQVDGTTTTINSTTVAIDDLNFQLATDAADGPAANGAGITIGGAGATLTYTSADDRWNLNKNLNVATVYGALSGNSTTATTLQNARNINGTSFNGSADITTANWGTSRNITIGRTSKAVSGSADVNWSIDDIGLPDGANSVRQWTVAANGATGRRHTIGRVYGTPNHWVGTWQNIRIKILQEDYSSGYVEYNLFGYYGMGNGNSWVLRLKDADGANTVYFRVSLGTVTYAGWQYSGQNTYYQDIYIDVDYYTTVRVIATTYGHSYQSTDPVDGSSGCYTVFYDSPATADITYTNDDKSSTYHFGDKILNSTNYSSYALPLTGGTLTGRLTLTGSAQSDSYSGTVRIVPNSTQQWAGISFPDANNSITNANNYWFYGRGTAIEDRTLTVHIPSYSDYSSVGIIPSWGVYTTGAVNLFKVWADGSVTAGGNTVLNSSNYSSYALPLTGGTLTGGLTINAALSVQQYNEASYRKWDYSWGGAQDLNWYRVATLRSTVTDGWRGTSGKITVYDENSNHGVATRTEFTAYFTAQYSSGGSPLDTGIIYPGPGASNYIRLYKVDTRHYEVQVRQLYDWRLMGAILEIDEDTGNLSSFDTTLQPANTTGTVVNNSSEYSENINIIGGAGKLTTARTITIGSTGKTFDGSANVSWSLAEIGAQATLTSGTNIKTINGTSLLGSGDITISGGGGGSGVTPWSRKTSNYTAAIGDRLIADTTSGTFTITLPASPTTGSEVIIADGYDYRINSLTVARNGNTIEGLTDDVTLDIGGIVTTFVYDGTTWEIYISHGAGGGTIANDTTTASDLFYPTMAYNATSGIFSQVKVSSSKLYFNPSTGQLNSTNFNSLSDASEKRDIQVINNALELVKQMEGVFFNWKDTGLPGTGVIADNMLKILPEVVSVSDTGKKSVAYGNLVGVLIEAIKDLSAKVDNLIAKE